MTATPPATGCAASAVLQGVSGDAGLSRRPLAVAQGRRDLARFFQMRVSEVFGVDIHPAARIGKGIMIDHAHSIVIGETAVVGDNVSMLHSVTLGGTGKEEEDRHPKIGERRPDRRRRQGAGQYPGRRLQPRGRRLGGARGGAALQDGGRGSGQDRGRGGLRSALGRDGSASRRARQRGLTGHRRGAWPVQPRHIFIFCAVRHRACLPRSSLCAQRQERFSNTARGAREPLRAPRYSAAELGPFRS